MYTQLRLRIGFSIHILCACEYVSGCACACVRVCVCVCVCAFMFRKLTTLMGSLHGVGSLHQYVSFGKEFCICRALLKKEKLPGF